MLFRFKLPDKKIRKCRATLTSPNVFDYKTAIFDTFVDFTNTYLVAICPHLNDFNIKELNAVINGKNITAEVFKKPRLWILKFKIPEKKNTPLKVNITFDDWFSTGEIEIQWNQQQKTHFTVSTLIKNENLNLLEWFCYYKILGVEHFYIYDNGTEDLQELENIINLFQKQPGNHSTVTLIKWDFLYGPHSWHASSGKTSMERFTQIAQCNHALLKYGNCDWMLLCDVDEFCFPKEKTMLNTLKKYTSYSCIKADTIWFGRTDKLNKTDLTTQFFTKRQSIKNIEKNRTKCAVRPEKVKYYLIHRPDDIQGKEMHLNPKDFRINHYYCTSNKARCFFDGYWQETAYMERKIDTIDDTMKRYQKELLTAMKTPLSKGIKTFVMVNIDKISAITKKLKNIIYVIPAHGLGNKLFMIANGLALSLSNKSELALCKTKPHWHDLDSSRKLPIFAEKAFPKIEPLYKFCGALDIREIKEQHNKPWIYSHWQDIDDFTPVAFMKESIYFGYYQGVTFFKKYRKQILDYFSFADSIVLYAKQNYSDIVSTKKETVSIHIRWGDYIHYLKQKNKYTKNMPLLSQGYYFNAILKFKKPMLFFIFTDSAWKFSENIISPFIKSKGHTCVIMKGNRNHILDLYLQSKCKHNIIANSTFSWWGAYMNTHTKKMVYYPDMYDANTKKHRFPSEWIAIKDPQPIDSMEKFKKVVRQ